VFRTSTVFPFRILMMSFGLVAVPEGMFSARQSQAVAFTFIPRVAIATSACITAAAPVMSYFMPTIDSAGFRERPPVSKVIPLPTRARDTLAPAGLYSNFTRRGGLEDPLPTAWIPPRPAATRSFSSQTFIFIGRFLEAFFACWVMTSGYRSLAG